LGNVFLVVGLDRVIEPLRIGSRFGSLELTKSCSTVLLLAKTAVAG
jgi:hypothetical protein